MSIEVMKQALAALETCDLDYDYEENPYTTYDEEAVYEAITALRQAIQEAALQKLTDIHQEMEQKPVAWWNPDEPDLSEQGRNRSAVLGNNIQAMVDAGLPFLDALETTLKVYDHPAKPQEDTAYRPGGLSMEQNPVAWWNPDESGLAFQKLRGDWQPLYAAPVHAIDINKKCVDEMAKDKHEPDVYGDGNVYRGQRSKDSETKTLHLLREENAKLWGWVNELSQKRNPTTPPKREWKGMTDKEIQQVVYDLGTIGDLSHDEFDIARAVAQALKERNT